MDKRPGPASSCELVVNVLKGGRLWTDKGSSSTERAFAAVRVESPGPCWLLTSALADQQPNDAPQPSESGDNKLLLESGAVPSLEESQGDFIFPFSFRTSLSADRGSSACQSLLDRPLSLSLQYVPNVGPQQTVGKAVIDLSSFVTNAGTTEVRGSFPVVTDQIAAATEGEESGSRPSSGAKAKQGGKDKGSKAGSKGGKEVPPAEPEAEPFPGLLPDACLDIVVTLKTPLLSAQDAEGSTVLELGQVSIGPLPAKLVELAQADPTKDPFNYTFALDPLPQLRDSSSANPDSTNSQPPQSADSQSAASQPVASVASLEASSALALLSGGTITTDASVNGPALIFPKPARRFLNAREVEAHKGAVKSGAKWTAEIARYLKEERSDLIDPLFERYHACFEVDLSALLRPGETLLETRAPLKTLPQALIAAKEAKKDEKPAKGAKAAKPQTPDTTEAASQPPDSATTRSGNDLRQPLLKPQERQDSKKAKSVEDGKDLPENGTCAWEVCGSEAAVQVSLARPMEPRWQPPPKAEIDLRTLVPDRPIVETRKEPAEVALEAFQALVKQTLAELAEEFSHVAGAEAFAHTDKKARKEKLVASLAASGKWFAVKERMKATVAKIAEERAKDIPVSLSRDGLYGDLYVALLDEIHRQLHEELQEKDAPPSNPVLPDAAQKLRQWAAEYEACADVQAAEKLYQDLVSGQIGCTANDWHSYGAFCLRTKQPSKAEECLREAICQDRKHVPTYLALACVLWDRGQTQKAEALLQEVTGNSDALLLDVVAAWTVLALVYEDMPNRSREVRNCLLEANRLNDSVEGILRVYLQAAKLCLEFHLPRLAVRALAAQEGIQSDAENQTARLLSARAKRLEGDLEGAEQCLEGCQGLECSLELGHVHCAAARPEAALAAYSKARESAEGSLPLSVYVQLGSLHQSLGQSEEAKEIYLEACKHHPCAATWLGAGRALYRLGDMPRAEQALAEANALNPRQPGVWAYLALVCLEDPGRKEEAQLAVREAIRNELGDEDLLREVRSKCLERGLYI